MTTPKTAFLWDESFLWGLMAYKALKELGLPFDLIRAEDVRAGILNDYQMLFVPGGWASNKIKALGGIGVKAVQSFVADGGNYLGFCGGAGLATLDGIGLLNIKRKPTKERVPSFSGRIHLQTIEHSMWSGIKSQEPGIENLPLFTLRGSPVFHAWWPSQFIVQDESIRVLASYGDALPDAFSSDLNVGDVESNGKWEDLEKVYQINLDPKRLLDEPAVIEGNYGKGKVILSLVHFDTPEDDNGQVVLRNLWKYLGSHDSEEERKCGSAKGQIPASELISELEATVAELIAFGERNFLWFRRNAMLLQWRRGVRGLEYCTLYEMIKEIAEEHRAKRIEQSAQSADSPLLDKGGQGGGMKRSPYTDENLQSIKELLIPFIEKVKKLLMLERLAMQKGHITYEKCDDPEIRALRLELFSESKSHGGMFKDLIDKADECLFLLLKVTA